MLAQDLVLNLKHCQTTTLPQNSNIIPNHLKYMKKYFTVNI